MEDNFIHVFFSLVSYATEKIKIAPLLKIEDRAIDMQIMTENGGRSSLIRYFINCNDGKHFNLEEERPTEGITFFH